MTEVVGLVVLACLGLLVAAGVVPDPLDAARPVVGRLRRSASRSGPRRRWLRAGGTALAVGAGLGMPAAGMAAGLAAWHADRLAGLWRRSLEPIERGDAIAGWAEMLAGSIEAGRGVQQAVVRTAPRVRDAIRPEASALITRLEHSPLPMALVGLDDELDHPCGDLLAGALALAAAGDTQDVSTPLRIVADRSRLLSEKLAAADAKRATARKTARTVLWTFGVVGPIPLVVLRSSMQWYRTAGGAVFVGAVAASVSWALLRLRSLAELHVPERVLGVGLAPGPRREAGGAR